VMLAMLTPLILPVGYGAIVLRESYLHFVNRT
jgi:hypothetical protein